jgi:hypothetical protein
MEFFYFLLAFGCGFCHSEKPVDCQQVAEKYRSGKRRYVYSMRNGKLDSTCIWYAKSGPALMVEKYVQECCKTNPCNTTTVGGSKASSFTRIISRMALSGFSFRMATSKWKARCWAKKVGIERRYYPKGQLL